MGVPSQPLIAVPLAVLLTFLTLPIAKRVARTEKDPSLVGFLMWACVIHLLFAPIQIWVVNHYYHGITDYNRYIDQGAVIADSLRRFHYSTPYNFTFLGQGSVSMYAAIVFLIVGVNKLACFFVFNWLAFLGSICFFKAFRTTFPEAPTKRYAWLCLFLPSILFWTAGVSKETVMYIGLGVAAWGAARVMAYRRGGAILLGIGTLIGAWVRPQELLLFLSVVAVATMFRRKSRKPFGFARRVFVVGVQVLLVLGALALTQELSKHGAAVFNLQQVNQNNVSSSSSTSAVPYSSNPAAYPRDVYVVLLDPLPIHAHGKSQLVAALENLTIIIVALTSWRRVRHLFRVCVLRPYVFACLVYSLIFCYAFASLGNLGLIDRERVLMLPFLMVLFAIPVSKKGEPKKYEWEMSRKKRKSLNAPKRPAYTYAPSGIQPVTIPPPPPRRPARQRVVSSQAWNMRTSHSSY
jgi:hypothetical protein